MNHQSLATRAALRRTLVAAALATAYSTSWSLPVFTFNPNAVALNGASVTADNILLSDFFSVTAGPAGTFTESGYLSLTGFQLGNANLVAGGLNNTYSLYIQFNGTGRTTAGTDPFTGVTAGVFDTLNYSLIGSTGNATFGFAGTTPIVTPNGTTQVLATGSLINGSVVTTPSSPSFVPSANATVSFSVAAGKQAFFSPAPFYDVAFTAFTNAVSTVTPLAGGFLVNNGGGNMNFAAPIPEPETYALMLGGLGIMGWMARRRRT